MFIWKSNLNLPYNVFLDLQVYEMSEPSHN